jgi:hypothetical protein
MREPVYLATDPMVMIIKAMGRTGTGGTTLLARPRLGLDIIESM